MEASAWILATLLVLPLALAASVPVASEGTLPTTALLLTTGNLTSADEAGATVSFFRSLGKMVLVSSIYPVSAGTCAEGGRTLIVDKGEYCMRLDNENINFRIIGIGTDSVEVSIDSTYAPPPEPVPEPIDNTSNNSPLVPFLAIICVFGVMMGALYALMKK